MRGGMVPKEITQTVLDKLRERLKPDYYEAWCRNLKIERQGETAFRISVPNPFYRDFLERGLGEALGLVLAELGIANPTVKFIVDASAAVEPAPVRPTLKSVPSAKNPAGIPPMTAPRLELPPPVRRFEIDDKPAILSSPPGTSPIGYAEGNFARLPFSLVSDKGIKTAREILIDQTVRSKEGSLQRVWRVTPGASGMPGPFDHSVFRALEKYALDTTIRKGLPLQNPIFFHLKTLIEILKLYYNSKNVGCVSQALKRLQEISIDDLGLYQQKNERRKGVTRKMHLLETVKAAGEVTTGGAVSGTHAVYFSQEYVDSVNARYVRPLDWELWLSLDRPIARRLVEVLDTDFYGLKNGPHVAYGYAELCQLIPVKPQKFLSMAMKVLDRAHQELEEKKYLKCRWDLSSKGFPRVLYIPGERWFGFQQALGHAGSPSDEAKNLARELGEADRASFYQQILNRAPDYVNEALKDLRALALAGRTPANPAAWFIGSLKQILSEKGKDLFPLR